MPTSTSVRPMTPPTVWLARGRHVGPAAEDVLRRHLQQLKDSGVIRDWLEVPEAEGARERVFEARWESGEGVTVRARLSLAHGPAEGGQEWVLAAEAEAAWDPRWPSPVTMFWPDDPVATWDHEAETGAELRFRDVNPLPSDDRELRRLLKDAARSGWSVHFVVHEAMTPDARGRLPLARLLPPGLRHRVVEHRAAPQQLRAVNWALRDSGVQVPRGGAVVLPGAPAPEGYDGDAFAVRSVFLDGSEPAELTEALSRFAGSARPLPDGAEEVLTALREDWHLLTLEEELAREKALVKMYAEALEAMTRSRDLYREAAERAHEALTAYRESAAALPEPPAREQPQDTPTASPLQQLTRTLERLKGGGKARRATGGGRGESASDGSDSPAG
ncbi:hypothetical protein I2W78_01730 [Streptomyces spinoverrucosus]|uniref:hypothetical protein n=1 Tax=Streptomyces spinoverrucosus TaxID=284043 RepID=UPI0018C409EF|nr:hypothetical protein [Streptomyces spinoverrucosus]MBG0850608.1 hypothetical protein [Streptomyces spinoverrucosus]